MEKIALLVGSDSGGSGRWWVLPGSRITADVRSRARAFEGRGWPCSLAQFPDIDDGRVIQRPLQKVFGLEHRSDFRCLTWDRFRGLPLPDRDAARVVADLHASLEGLEKTATIRPDRDKQLGSAQGSVGSGSLHINLTSGFPAENEGGSGRELELRTRILPRRRSDHNRRELFHPHRVEARQPDRGAASRARSDPVAEGEGLIDGSRGPGGCAAHHGLDPIFNFENAGVLALREEGQAQQSKNQWQTGPLSPDDPIW